MVLTNPPIGRKSSVLIVNEADKDPHCNRRLAAATAKRAAVGLRYRRRSATGITGAAATAPIPRSSRAMISVCRLPLSCSACRISLPRRNTRLPRFSQTASTYTSGSLIVDAGIA